MIRYTDLSASEPLDAASEPLPFDQICGLLHSHLDVKADCTSIRSVAEAVDKSKNQVVLIVDELAQLYQTANRTWALQYLNQLRALAHGFGRSILVLACSSTGAAEWLIKRSEDRHLQGRYPLVTEAPELNGSKFTVYRMRPLSSIEADVRNRTRAVWPHSATHINLGELFFWTSGNPRRIVTFARGAARDRDPLPCSVPAVEADGNLHELCVAAYGRLGELNSDFVNSYSVSCYPRSIFRLKPLSPEDVSEIVQEFNAKAKVAGANFRFSSSQFETLVDHNALESVGSMQYGATSPAALLGVVRSIPGRRQIWKEYLTAGLSLMGSVSLLMNIAKPLWTVIEPRLHAWMRWPRATIDVAIAAPAPVPVPGPASFVPATPSAVVMPAASASL